MVGATPAIDIKGALVLNEEVYRAVIDLPDGAPADETTLELAKNRVLTFLRKAGYDLASVSGRVDHGTIFLNIEEGQLDKVVVRDRGSFGTLRLMLDLNLPHKVFNRPFLERQLESLRKKYDAVSVRYELVEVKKVADAPDLSTVKDPTEISKILLSEQRPFELHIFFDEREWPTGFTLDLGLGFPDGLSVTPGYQNDSLILNDDRWRVEGKVGARFRQGESYPSFSRGVLAAQWFSPALFDSFRPMIDLSGDILHRERLDIQLDSYFLLTLESSLRLTQSFFDVITVGIGAGADRRFLFDVKAVQGVATPVIRTDPTQILRPFGIASLDFDFDPDEPRTDRHHRVSLEGRHFLGAGTERGTTRITLHHEKVFPWGWHEIWITNEGGYVLGHVAYTDELPVDSNYVRGVFADRFYAERAASLTLEFRFSLARDLFKVSAFHDLAVFGAIDRLTRTEKIAAADSFGLGFHALILDAFQLDIYYAFGLNSAESPQSDHGLSANLVKAF